MPICNAACEKERGNMATENQAAEIGNYRLDKYTEHGWVPFTDHHGRVFHFKKINDAWTTKNKLGWNWKSYRIIDLNRGRKIKPEELNAS